MRFKLALHWENLEKAMEQFRQFVPLGMHMQNVFLNSLCYHPQSRFKRALGEKFFKEEWESIKFLSRLASQVFLLLIWNLQKTT